MSTASKRAAINRKARRDYTVLEQVEAGIELLGTEVKSIRTGNVTLTGGYAVIDHGQVILHDVHIEPYAHGNRNNHAATRPRRLLLHKLEIRKLAQRSAEKGHTLVPLSIYFKGGLIKLALGICRGKVSQDKRDAIKRRTADREAARAISARQGK